MYSMPFSFVSKQKLERSLTLNSISLIFSRFLLWEELGGPEKDLFVFWLVLKKTGFFFFFFFFCLEIVSFRSPFFYCKDSAGFSKYSLASKLDLGTLAALVGESSSISLCLSESHLSFLRPWNSTA